MSDDHDRIHVDTDNVIAREVDGEVVILDLREQVYVAGNRAVTALWPLLEAGTSREEMVARLAERFGLERDRAEADVDAFLLRLSELGLVRPAQPGP